MMLSPEVPTVKPMVLAELATWTTTVEFWMVETPTDNPLAMFLLVFASILSLVPKMMIATTPPTSVLDKIVKLMLNA
jgi:hypothetical protein